MSNSYQAVQWNRHKRVYDLCLLAGIVLFLAGFIAFTAITHPSPDDLAPPPILIMRATATCAFLMLHLILMIGPLARLSPRFAPLLYNRRHFGVAMFCVAMLHSIVALSFYHGLGNENVIWSLLTANQRFDSWAHFPFQLLGLAGLLILFVMAATSHDLVDPTVPAGLVRISNGSGERFIWPVHLGGWQQQGWTLIAAATGVKITPQQTAPAAVIEVPLAEETPEPSSSEPMPASTAAGGAASWELETSATGEALLLDDPLL